MNKLILLMPLLFFMIMGIANATSPTIPAGINYYVPVNITNSQTSATPNPFQQMVTVNALNYTSYINYNNNFANFEYFYSNGTIISAWIESNNSKQLTTWTKINGGIAGSTKLTIYLGFASKTTNLLSNSGTTGIGEAPQLSSTYAQYDDGVSVFPNYWNFAGTSLPTGWTSSGSDLTVDNGITLSGSVRFE